MQKPLLPCLFDPGDAAAYLGHIPELLKSLRTKSRVGKALVVFQCSDHNSVSLQRLTEKLAEALRVWRHAWLMDLGDTRVWPWLILRFQAIRHRMLSIGPLPWECEALRAALVIWNTMVRSKWGAQKIVKSAVFHLRRYLERCEPRDPWYSSSQRKWILTVGAMAAKSTTEEHWFQDELKHVSEIGSPTECHQELKTLSMECFYFEPLQEGDLLTLCSTITGCEAKS